MVPLGVGPKANVDHADCVAQMKQILPADFSAMNERRLVDAMAQDPRNVRVFPFEIGLDGPARIYCFREIHKSQVGGWVKFVWPTTYLYKLIGCRMDGFFDYRLQAMDNVAWPLKWNYMSEKHSINAVSQDHYQLLYIKTVFYICYLIFICFLSLILRSKMDVLYQSVMRRVYRQKILRRNRLQDVRFLASDRSYDSIKRAKTAELRIQK